MNTLISVFRKSPLLGKICFYFLMKQIISIDPVKLEIGKKHGKSFNYDDNFIKNLYSKIAKGETKVWDCFLQENIFYKNEEINYYNLEHKINYDFIKLKVHIQIFQL